MDLPTASQSSIVSVTTVGEVYKTPTAWPLFSVLRPCAATAVMCPNFFSFFQGIPQPFLSEINITYHFLDIVGHENLATIAYKICWILMLECLLRIMLVTILRWQISFCAIVIVGTISCIITGGRHLQMMGWTKKPQRMSSITENV